MKNYVFFKDFEGEFETHWTVSLAEAADIEALRAWAAAHQLKCVHIILDRGATPSQPMLTGRTQGSNQIVEERSKQVVSDLEEEGFVVTRVKVETAPNTHGVPQTDGEAGRNPHFRYFESHVKLLVPPDADLQELRLIVNPHGAHLSRNALKSREDGQQERFVTQRGFDIGAKTAHHQLQSLLHALKRLPYPVLDVEEEYVVSDSNGGLDRGWLPIGAMGSWEGFWKTLFGLPGPHDDPLNQCIQRSGYPRTFPPLSNRRVGHPRVEIFDPSVLHCSNAFKLSDPKFGDDEKRQRWRHTRLMVNEHLLRLLATSPWREKLVLRGSMTLRAWLGAEARHPGDIDWVYCPDTIKLGSQESLRLFEYIQLTAAENSRVGDVSLRLDETKVDNIWTYERAAGRRIIIPWSAPELPPGEVQMDVVFQEPLPEAPILMGITPQIGAPFTIRAASRELSLAWKLLWLATDSYPQGKDLYDAVLLAEQTHLSEELLRRVLAEFDSRYMQMELSPEIFLAQEDLDWDNFQKEYPWIQGDAQEWRNRLACALASTTFQNRRQSVAD